MQWCTETMTEERPQAPDGDRLAGLDRPLRNRVTPAGELIATEHRGTMYGNRGVLHNENLALVRRYQVRRWLACVLEFRGRRRPIMRPRRYTELFFLDEAVALAAGHRPCAECRHAAYQSFLTAWTAARALPAKPAADDIDQVLHWQRRLVDGARVTYPALLSELPDGVFIVHDDEFWLANDGGLNRWTPAGYTDRIDQFDGPAAVLTPHATVEAIRAGYRPLVHLYALPERVCGLIRRCPGHLAPGRAPEDVQDVRTKKAQNACHVLCNAPRRVCWRDGAYVNLNRVKLIIERYSSHAAFCNVTAPLTCSYVAV